MKLSGMVNSIGDMNALVSLIMLMEKLLEFGLRWGRPSDSANLIKYSIESLIIGDEFDF